MFLVIFYLLNLWYHRDLRKPVKDVNGVIVHVSVMQDLLERCVAMASKDPQECPFPLIEYTGKGF